MMRKALFVFIACSFLHGHGVVYSVGEGRAVVLKVSYDDGSPMDFAEVRVFAPGDTLEYAMGSTDARGFFAFCPSRKGEWKVMVSDGMGHGINRTFEVREDLTVDFVGNGAEPLWRRILFGASLIWAISLTLYFRLERGRRRNAHT